MTARTVLAHGRTGYVNRHFKSFVDSLLGVWGSLEVKRYCGWDHNCPGKSHDFKSYIINKCLIGVVTAYATYEFGAAVWKAGENMTADDEVGFI